MSLSRQTKVFTGEQKRYHLTNKHAHAKKLAVNKRRVLLRKKKVSLKVLAIMFEGLLGTFLLSISPSMKVCIYREIMCLPRKLDAVLYHSQYKTGCCFLSKRILPSRSHG